MDRKNCKEIVLLAGPFTGEFGWELFQWQGYVRQQREMSQKIIVCGYPDRAPLYEDFCDAFIPLPQDFLDLKLPQDGLSVSVRRWNEDRVKQGLEHSEFNLDELNRRIANMFPYARQILPHCLNIPMTSQAWGPWARRQLIIEKRITVVRRHRTYMASMKNWNSKNWDSLIEKLQEAGYNVIDPPPEFHALKDAFNSSALAIGASTGGMHLASLCGCPHLVWGPMSQKCADYTLLSNRYKTAWNPLNTPCWTADLGWHPTVGSVLERVYAVLEANRRLESISDR